MRFFLRLRNRGFRKYMLSKLFSKITYAQRDELLKIDAPLSNALNSVTLQEAERRMILDGEKALAASQEEAKAKDIPARMELLAHNHNNNTNSTNNNNSHHTDPRNTAGTSRHSRVLSIEGWNLVFSPPWLCIYQKTLVINICLRIF